MALFSASRIGRGIETKAAGRVVAAGRFVVVVDDDGSFELQLDTPNAASSPSEITVHARRNGVQNLIVTSFLSDIMSTTLLLFTKPERVENHRHLTL